MLVGLDVVLKALVPATCDDEMGLADVGMSVASGSESSDGLTDVLLSLVAVDADEGLMIAAATRSQSVTYEASGKKVKEGLTRGSLILGKVRRLACKNQPR